MPCEVVLVDENDLSVGICEKIEAHKLGLLHRAFSIFIFRIKNGKSQLLLQRRAEKKYHSHGLLSNTCCSHPKFNEDILISAKSRLFEEMGITCELYYAGNFIYRAFLDQDLIEHELDHVFVGFLSNVDYHFQINPQEVQEFVWTDLNNLERDLVDNPKLYTAWLPKALNISKKGLEIIRDKSLKSI